MYAPWTKVSTFAPISSSAAAASRIIRREVTCCRQRRHQHSCKHNREISRESLDHCLLLVADLLRRVQGTTSRCARSNTYPILQPLDCLARAGATVEANGNLFPNAPAAAGSRTRRRYRRGHLGPSSVAVRPGVHFGFRVATSGRARKALGSERDRRARPREGRASLTGATGSEKGASERAKRR